MDYRFSSNMELLQLSSNRNFLKLPQGKEMISFAGDVQAEKFFPSESIREAADRVFSSGKAYMQQEWSEDFIPLREQICERMSQKGMNTQPEQMILTTGSQQSIDLIVRILAEPGAVVLVENPTSLTSLQLFHLSGMRVIPVASDRDGMIKEDLMRLMKQYKPRLVYVMPNFSNPTGRAWSLERRLDLLELCHQHGVVILEDDPYGDIQFDERVHYPTLFSLEGKAVDGCVVYTSTFSKTVAPVLSTGWVMGEPRVIQMLTKAKITVDQHPSTIDQQILSQLLSQFPLDAHIHKITEAYSKQMQTMQGLLRQLNIRDMKWLEPKGGIFLWLELPEGLDAEALLRGAVSNNVSFIPGAAFYCGDPQRNTLRLNFTHIIGEHMALGVKGLGEAINDFIARS